MNKKLNLEEIMSLAVRSENQIHGGVDIIQIACELGIDVISTNECDPYFNAAIKFDPQNNKFQILVNESHSRNRVRFSIAHEIAHYILHRNKIIEKGMMARSDEENEETEEQADELAGRLLIPDQLLEKFVIRNNILKTHDVTKDQLSWVSNHFRVSYIVAAIRLRNFGYKVPYISFSYVA